MLATRVIKLPTLTQSWLTHARRYLGSPTHVATGRVYFRHLPVLQNRRQAAHCSASSEVTELQRRCARGRLYEPLLCCWLLLLLLLASASVAGRQGTGATADRRTMWRHQHCFKECIDTGDDHGLQTPACSVSWYEKSVLQAWLFQTSKAGQVDWTRRKLKQEGCSVREMSEWQFSLLSTCYMYLVRGQAYRGGMPY
jgi:hypothetical protein